MKIPNDEAKNKILNDFNNEMKSYVYCNKNTEELEPIFCASCDCIQTYDNKIITIQIDDFANLCDKCNMEAKRLEPYYPPRLLHSYCLQKDERLKKFVLSPNTLIDDSNDTTRICNNCYSILKKEAQKRQKARRKIPPNAIANFHLIGEAPEELKCLNDVELSLVSLVRVYCQSWVFFAGCHQHIKGWQTFYPNRPESNVRDIELLSISGMKGKIVVTLVGPFTKQQEALVRKRTSITAENVINAYKWLKKNNHYYYDIDIPKRSDIFKPIIIHENM